MAEGVISLTAPSIFSEGAWVHGGALTVAGPVTAATSLTSPLITGAVHTHTHPIVSGSSAGVTGPGVG